MQRVCSPSVSDKKLIGCFFYTWPVNDIFQNRSIPISPHISVFNKRCKAGANEAFYWLLIFMF